MSNLIYHYSNTDTIYKIIRSRSIWFSDITKTNDPTEYQVGFEIVSKIVIDCFPKLYFILNEIHPDNINEKFKILSASFSRDGDCLSLWRMYGDDGEGAAICFNMDNLKSYALFARYIKQMSPVFGSILFFEIKYSNAEFQKVIRDFLDSWSHQDNFVNQGMLKSALIRFCYTYKSRDYRDEREIRAVVEVDEAVTPYDVKTRDGTYGKTHYHELNTEFESISSIKSVVLGPKCKMTPIEFENEIRIHGLDKMDVSKSKVQYR